MFTGRWALPGGFVGPDESLEQAAYREFREEAGIGADAVRLEQLRSYGDPGRDPRPERVVSVAWHALGADLPDPTPATDADRAEWVPIDEALARELAFDHTQILRDGVERARAKLEYRVLRRHLHPARPAPGLPSGVGHRDRPPQLPAQGAERHGLRGGDRRDHSRTGKAGEGLPGWGGDDAAPGDHAALSHQASGRVLTQPMTPCTRTAQGRTRSAPTAPESAWRVHVPHHRPHEAPLLRPSLPS